MKRFIFAFLLTVAAFHDLSYNDAAAAEKAAHHLCGAPTKKGTPCKHHVSDAKGKDAKCFQHNKGVTK